MQQTEKYKLNLIERDDVFLPDALNQNTQKVENVLSAALAGETAAREEDVSVLDARITTLEAHKIVCGRYVGSGTEQFINLGFTPAALFVSGGYASEVDMIVGENILALVNLWAQIKPGGFTVLAPLGGTNANAPGKTYYYVAIL